MFQLIIEILPPNLVLLYTEKNSTWSTNFKSLLPEALKLLSKEILQLLLIRADDSTLPGDLYHERKETE